MNPSSMRRFFSAISLSCMGAMISGSCLLRRAPFLENLINGAVASLADVQSVGVSGIHFRNEHIRAIARDFPEAKNLYIANTAIDREGLRCVEALVNLESLAIVMHTICDHDLPSFFAWRQLYSLDLSECKIGELTVKHITENNRELSQLFLSKTQLNDACLPRLAELRQLAILDVSHNEMSGPRKSDSCYFKALRVLDASYTHWDDEACHTLSMCSKLETCNIANTMVTDDGLKELSHCPLLYWLDLSGIQISEKGISYLREAKSLAILKLARICISTNILQAIVTSLANLTSLHLSACELSECNMRTLKSSPTLREIYLDDTQMSVEYL